MALATKKIPELTALNAALQGTEELEIWTVGLSRRIFARDFILPGIDSVITATPLGVVGSMARQLASSASVLVNDGGAGGLITLTAVSAIGAPTGLQVLVALAGNNNNVALTNAQVGFLDVNTAAGAADLTGIVPPQDGFIVTITNIGANLLRLMALTTSLAANQFRLPSNIALVTNSSYTLRYSSSIGKWVPYS
jgi:hypothetical protein